VTEEKQQELLFERYVASTESDQLPLGDAPVKMPRHAERSSTRAGDRLLWAR